MLIRRKDTNVWRSKRQKSTIIFSLYLFVVDNTGVDEGTIKFPLILRRRTEAQTKGEFMKMFFDELVKKVEAYLGKY